MAWAISVSYTHLDVYKRQNKLGVKIEHNVDPRDFFAASWGDIVCEVPDGMVGQLSISYTLIGEVTDRETFEYGPVSISMDEALKAWTSQMCIRDRPAA